MTATIEIQRLLAKLPAIVVRVLLYSYENQFAWARWGSATSGQFRVRNGTRQGSIFSPDAWSCYTDPLLERLRALGHVRAVRVLHPETLAQVLVDDLLDAQTRRVHCHHASELEVVGIICHA